MLNGKTHGKCPGTNRWNNYLYNVLDLVRAFFVNGPHQDKTRSVELYLHSALYTKDCPMAIIEFLVVAAPEQADSDRSEPEEQGTPSNNDDRGKCLVH